MLLEKVINYLMNIKFCNLEFDMIINGMYVKACQSKTILQSAEEANVSLMQHCKDGYCGFCRAKITKGEVSYQIEPIASSHSSEIFPCIAYASNDDIEIIQT